MNRSILLAALSFFSFKALSQEEVVIDYFPEQNENVSDEDYQKGLKTLKSTYDRMKSLNTKEISSAVYWSVATGYGQMGQDPEIIERFLINSHKLNENGFCAAVNASLEMSGGDLTKMRFHSILGEKFSTLIDGCVDLEEAPLNLSDLMKEKENTDLTNLNEPLIDKMIVMQVKDQRYRRGSFEDLKANEKEQNKLDKEVSKELRTIFKTFGYPGKDIVGEKYQNYACLFLEHTGELADQEKYLPLVSEAFKNDQMDITPIQMLIDRIHSTKTGKQIFGSHAGVPFDSDEVIAEMTNKYLKKKD